MSTMTITHPTTNRNTTVRVWTIDSMTLAKKIGAGESPKAVGRALLDEALPATDKAASKFALNAFETALDWGLGLAAGRFLRAAVANKKIPRKFRIAANKKGDVFCILGGVKPGSTPIIFAMDGQAE
jgi:hypothetical protein